MSLAAYTPPPFQCSIVVVQTSGNLGKTFKFERKDWCVLGANRDCDIIVPFSGVAQLQALVFVKKNGVFLCGIDEQMPVKHTRLQKSLLDEEEILLLPGDVFELGERKFLIEYNAEDAGIENSNRQRSSITAPATSRSTTPRSNWGGRRRRKSSLVVREFDEEYIRPKRSADSLLSKTQLARISLGEIENLPTHDVHRSQDGEESSSGEISTDASQEADGSADSATDNSLMSSDHVENVSRSIDFSTFDREPLSTENNSASVDTAEVDFEGTASSGAKRDTIFSRLSKGLSATPYRSRKQLSTSRQVASARKASGHSRFEGVRTPIGKENKAQHVKHVFASSKKQAGKEDEQKNRFRSPLANRDKLENQIESVLSLKGTPSSKRRTGAPRSSPRVVQTPTNRSVVFASSIELARGAHYSPFRPRKAATTAEWVADGYPENTAQLKQSHSPNSRFPLGSPSHPQKQHFQSMKDHEEGIAPTAGLEQLGTFYYPKKTCADEPQRRAAPAVEYDDDSNPPTPSTIDEAPKSLSSDFPGPSPMARVGGALAAFLRRLSGTLESDEDDVSPEKDTTIKYKRVSEAGLREEELKSRIICSEPVMSSSELVGLSTAIPPTEREELVGKVEGAAQDMRKAMQPVLEDYIEEGPSDQKDLVGDDGTTEHSWKQVCHVATLGNSASIDDNGGQELEVQKPEGDLKEDVASAEATDNQAQSIKELLCAETNQEDNMSVSGKPCCDLILSSSTSTESEVAQGGLESKSHSDSEPETDSVADKVKEDLAFTNGEVECSEEDTVKDIDVSADDKTGELKGDASQLMLLQKELSRLKKDELKAKLEQHDLNTSGLKKDLVQRLALHLSLERSAVENLPSEDNLTSPKRPSEEEKNPAQSGESDSMASHMTPRMLRSRQNIAKGNPTEDSDSVACAPSDRKAKSKTPSKSPPDLSSYRRRTVKELRHFLKNRNLETDQKMRKEELIQHLISLSIGSDGQDQDDILTTGVAKLDEEPKAEIQESEKPSSTGVGKSFNKMTVVQLRAELKERGQCHAGIKKALVARLSLVTERRTRSKKTVDATACSSCQAGETCSAENR